jgi:hypothetical protein
MPIPALENPLVVAPDLAGHALDGFHAPVREQRQQIEEELKSGRLHKSTPLA